jgi:hypothetical protein
MVKLPRTIRAVFTLAAAMLATMALGIGAAAAQDYPPGEGGLAIDCVAAGEAGASVTCTVTGAEPNEQLTASAEVQGNVFWTEVLSANAQGEATFRFTVPREHRGQEITVRVVGAISGEIAEDTVTIAAPGRTGEPVPPRRLAFSGMDAAMYAGLGVVLLGGGLLLLRRRSAATADNREHTSV